ncbi:hypothetical protein [Planomonospora sphaerica]|nr:hypothetical protein [Planomonospora sphaerica]
MIGGFMGAEQPEDVTPEPGKGRPEPAARTPGRAAGRQPGADVPAPLGQTEYVTPVRGHAFGAALEALGMVLGFVSPIVFFIIGGQSKDRLYGESANLWPAAIAVLVGGIVSAALICGFGRLLKVQSAIFKELQQNNR